MNIPCSQIKPPLAKLSKNFNTFVIYAGLFTFSYTLLQLFVMPYWPAKNSNLYFYVHMLLCNIFFLWASFADPGVIKGTKGLTFSKLTDKCDPQGLCPTCETIFTRDSRHCYICNKCIEKFDHHCQWINNCVGIGNHKIFFLYISTLLAYFIVITAYCIMALAGPRLDFHDL